jgi:hypothetical protein
VSPEAHDAYLRGRVESDASNVQSRAPELNVDSMRALYKRDGWKAYWDARMKMMLARENDMCVPYDIGVNYIRLGKPGPFCRPLPAR